MKVSIQSAIGYSSLEYSRMGELDLVAHNISAMFDNLHSYQKEHNVQLSNISIETKREHLGMQITVSGLTEGLEGGPKDEL